MHVRTHRALWAALLVAASTLAGNVVAAEAAPTIVPGRTAAPAGGTTNMGFGVGSGNINSQLGERIPSSITVAWSEQFTACDQSVSGSIRSIAIAGPRIFVRHGAYACELLEAVNLEGKILWADRLGNAAGQLKVANDKVYVPYIEQPTTMDTYGTVPVAAYAADKDVPDGVRLWSTEAVDKESGSEYHTGEAYLTSVEAGLVATGTAISDAETGKFLFELPLEATAARGTPESLSEGVEGSRGGTTFITGSSIIYNSNTDVEAFSLTGQHLWTYLKTGGEKGPGYGHAVPSYTRGHLYIRSSSSFGPAKTLVLNATSGSLERTLPGSAQPLAIDGHVGIFTTPGTTKKGATLTAVDTGTGYVYWTHTLTGLGGHPGAVASAPVIENGIVWFQKGNFYGSPGQLVSFSEKTGTTKTVTPQSCAPSGSNVAIGQRLIVTGTICGLSVYRGK